MLHALDRARMSSIINHAALYCKHMEMLSLRKASVKIQVFLISVININNTYFC